MAYIKNRFSRLFFGFCSELLMVVAGVTIAINFKNSVPIWSAILMIIVAVTIKMMIKNDLEK